MKRILVISPSPEWGGASTANISISQMLASAGYDVTYNDEFYKKDSFNGFPVAHYSIHGKEKGADKYLENLIKENNYSTIIWGNVWILRKYICTVRKLHSNGINQIAIFHSLSLGTSFISRVFEFICAQMMRYMNHIVFVSGYTERSWSKFSILAKHPEKGIVIHNPMDYNGDSHTKSKDRLTIGFVGRFTAEKQPEIFCSLSTEGSYDYIAFGDGPLLDEMKSKYPRVKYMGNCLDTDAIYRNIDILVMTSKFENCPMVVLESKSHGIPCVVPDVGGISEIVANGQDGILYKDYSKGEIHTAINMISFKYEEFSKNCLVRSKKFESLSLVDKWKSIL